MAYRARHSLNIVDRPVTKNKNEVPTVSLSAFAYLYSEFFQYALERSEKIGDLEKRLNNVGYEVGTRILELLSYRDKQMKRKPEVLDILRFVHSVVWPYMFGKAADDLQQANEPIDEYMIIDYDMQFTKFISVPKNYNDFSPAAIVAGVVRGILDAAGFPASVEAHTVARERAKPQTTILVKFHASVMERKQALESQRRG